MYLSFLLMLYIIAIQFLIPLRDYASQYNNGIVRTIQTAPTQLSDKTRLGDYCYHIFLDVGANVGVHGRFLLEPHKYPNTKRSVDLFQKEYALKDNQNVCVFEFEANSRHWPRLDEISDAYAQMGWRYHVIHAAVSDQEGTTTFFHQGKRDEKLNEYGFSGAKNHGHPDAFEVTVPTIRLAEWIQFHIHERIVPEVIGDKEKATPVVGMKMDIEGFEYVVLPDLIHSGAICNVDFAYGEFHPKLAPIRQFRKNIDNNTEKSSSNTTQKDHRVSLETRQEAKQYAHGLVQLMHASRNCDIRWDTIDDESYVHDGQPLPTANNTTMVGTRLRGR